eukprot:1560606-Pyramimonas_sp.AAC.1
MLPAPRGFAMKGGLLEQRAALRIAIVGGQRSQARRNQYGYAEGDLCQHCLDCPGTLCRRLRRCPLLQQERGAAVDADVARVGR